MPLKNAQKSSNEHSTATKSPATSKKKSHNGDSLRNELQGMIPELSSSNGKQNGNDDSSSSSSSSSIASSDDESGVFDTRFDEIEDL